MLDRPKSVSCGRNRWRYVASSLYFVVVLALPRRNVGEPLETFAHALTRHHIELTKPAIIEALRNPNNEVRGLAAWQLLK